MDEKEKTTSPLPRPRFAFQWAEYEPTQGQVFAEPSCTIPDQSMTIPEIIAKFTRTGMVPGTIAMRDNGGNVAADPESDPLDDYSAVQAAAAAAKAAEAERVVGPAGDQKKDLPIGGASKAGEAGKTGGAGEA